MKFRLLAGMHIQADKTQDPTPVKDPTTGLVTQRYPSKTYKQGEVVESDVDLVARLGANKFQLVGGGKANRKQMSLSELMSERAKLDMQIAEASRVAPLDAKRKEEIEREEAANALLEEGEEVDDDDRDDDNRVKKTSKKPNAFKDQLPEDLDEMTVAELKEYAEAEEIDISEVHLKADIVEAIRAAKS